MAIEMRRMQEQATPCVSLPPTIVVVVMVVAAVMHRTSFAGQQDATAGVTVQADLCT